MATLINKRYVLLYSPLFYLLESWQLFTKTRLSLLSGVNRKCIGWSLNLFDAPSCELNLSMVLKPSSFKCILDMFAGAH